MKFHKLQKLQKYFFLRLLFLYYSIKQFNRKEMNNSSHKQCRLSLQILQFFLNTFANIIK